MKANPETTQTARSNSASLWHSSCKHQVGIACFGLASLVLIVGQHMLSMPSSGLVHLPLFSRFPSFILGIVSKQCKSRQVLLSSWLACVDTTFSTKDTWLNTLGWLLCYEHAAFATRGVVSGLPLATLRPCSQRVYTFWLN